MNNLYNSALRQSTSLRRDLDALSQASSSNPTSPPPAALQGQISASLSSLSRTITDYTTLAAAELHEEKRIKATERSKTFRADLDDYRQRFEDLKRALDEHQVVVNKAELLGRRPHHAATPENPYATAAAATGGGGGAPWKAPPGGAPNPYGAANPFGSGDGSREGRALREQSFVQQSNAALDEFLDRGRAVLGDLGEQREMLKGTQRKLYSVANTLGISGDTIRMVERRARQDKWVFWGCVVGFVGFVWLCLHYLR